jgi:hypothetical protein
MGEQVECYSGAAYGERPVTFWWQGRRCQVRSVLKRWRLPQGQGFQVVTQDEQIFDLQYDEPEGCWQITERVNPKLEKGTP